MSEKDTETSRAAPGGRGDAEGGGGSAREQRGIVLLRVDAVLVHGAEAWDAFPIPLAQIIDGNFSRDVTHNQEQKERCVKSSPHFDGQFVAQYMER